MEIDPRVRSQRQVEGRFLFDLCEDAGNIVGVIECREGLGPEAVGLEGDAPDPPSSVTAARNRGFAEQARVKIILHHPAVAVEMILAHGRCAQVERGEVRQARLCDQPCIETLGILRVRKRRVIGHRPAG